MHSVLLPKNVRKIGYSLDLFNKHFKNIINLNVNMYIENLHFDYFDYNLHQHIKSKFHNSNMKKICLNLVPNLAPIKELSHDL